MNETTKNILNFDLVVTAETLFGKWNENWDTETDVIIALGIANAKNQAKELHLKSIGDTHLGITWIDFVEIAKAYGFKSGYCQKFTGIEWMCEQRKSLRKSKIEKFFQQKNQPFLIDFRIIYSVRTDSSMVARSGIEPLTRGFSVLCSTN